MANSKLEGKTFIIPEKMRNHLTLILQKYGDNKTIPGYKRLVELLELGYCTYEKLKHIKHYFDYADPNNEIEYNLNGGDFFKNWVTRTLSDARGGVLNTKVHNSNAGMTNQFNAAPDSNLDGVARTLKPNIRNYPEEIMNGKLLEQINKIKKLINL